MNRKELIKKYIDFFKSKNHKKIANSSLIPENDPTVLFTTAGMHPIVPFLLGQTHPLGKRLCGIQRCIRTKDIEEVGDKTHHTFFEMLGNWSLGDYWKKEAIEYSLEFLVKELKIPLDKISVTCFNKDKESAKIWEEKKVKKIKFLGKKDNWWGPAGKTGPCGPDTEIFIGKVEIWNNVFMEYYKNTEGNYTKAKQKNIDTGMGVERVTAILNNLKDDYLTESFKKIIEKIEEISKKEYSKNKKSMRIIADHIKTSLFIIGDGIAPGNKEQSYILRRLIRRAIRYGKEIGIKNFIKEVAEPVFKIYDDYEELKTNKNQILETLEQEEKKFNKTIEKGLNTFLKITKESKKLDKKKAFLLYQSFGFPIEMIEEECKKRKIKFSIKEFEKEVEKHKKLSQTASAGRFKSGLADNSEKTTKLHTATHILLQALKIILKDENIKQKGSNITSERLRFDFNFPRKLTKEEIKEIEDLVNAQIEEALEVKRNEISLEQARNEGACGIFDKKYGKIVSVYSIGDFSKEICTGPHVKNTSELGKFKIKKEESSSSGIRRIKAVLE